MKRAMRVITLSKKQSHTQHLFLSTNALPFEKMYNYCTCTFVYKQLTHNLPSIFDDYYTLNRNQRRQHNLIANKSKTNMLFFHIICSGPRNWNKLLNNGFSHNATFFSNFKVKLKEFLRNNDFD